MICLYSLEVDYFQGNLPIPIILHYYIYLFIYLFIEFRHALPLLFVPLMSQLGSISRSEVPMKVVYIIYVLHNKSMRHLVSTLRIVHLYMYTFIFIFEIFIFHSN